MIALQLERMKQQMVAAYLTLQRQAQRVVQAEAQQVVAAEHAARMEMDEFDLIAVGRALLANPDWPKLIRAGATDKLRTFNKGQLAELI